MDGTQVLAATPFFFGANPADVKDGSRKGLRIIGTEEDAAKDLYKRCTAEDQKQVVLQKKSFGEPGEKTLSPKSWHEAEMGLPAAKMTSKRT